MSISFNSNFPQNQSRIHISSVVTHFSSQLNSNKLTHSLKINQINLSLSKIKSNQNISSQGEMTSSDGGDSSMQTEAAASMMEQLVPEIRTHALSFLDYQSLCRLSMTNSVMRRAANDDNAWKLLFHKDFTLEQDNMTPPGGWKSYYAATRAVVNFNAEFFRIIRDRSLPAMGQFWLNADYVKAFHACGENCSGYNSVMESWEMAFSWEDVDFQVQEVRTRVLGDMAWVTMKACIDIEENYIMSNVYEFHGGRWFMVHHHSSATGMGDPLLVQ